MPNVEPSSRVSQVKLESTKDMAEQLDKLYERLARGINSKRDMLVRSRAPTANDYEYEVGTMWTDDSANRVYVLTSRLTINTVTWTEVS